MHVRQWVCAAVLVAAVAVSAVMDTQPRAAGTVLAPVQPGITAAQEAATFRWDPSVDPGTRSVIEAAVASARPEAKRLIDRIDGVTTLAVGVPPEGALGVAAGTWGANDVLLDVGKVYRENGQRGVNRLVLHELGHVIDRELLDDELRARLDGAIPPGLPCAAGTSTGSCAPQAERFAESFAKWAMRDIGVDLWIGYAVPAPPDLEAWGQPLAGL